MSAHTEAAMLDHLHSRYSRLDGNGVRYVCAEHVRSQAGFDAPRCADMIVQDLWPAKGLELIGHEVKVARSDWVAELKDPEKAATFRRHLHRWYLVVPDRSIVRDDLPVGWGLMALRAGKLWVVRPASLLIPEPMPATMTAALLRAVAKTAERRAILSPDVPTMCPGCTALAGEPVTAERRRQGIRRVEGDDDSPGNVSKITTTVRSSNA